MPFMTNVILMLKNVRNYRIFLSIKTRKDYYANLNVKDIVDNKKFWRTVYSLIKPSQMRKSLERKIKQLLHKMELLNLLFSSAVKNLKITLILIP